MDIRLKECLENKELDYIAPFLWLHGEEERMYIEELHSIHKSGIRSVCLESRTHEDFCRDGWWRDVRRILDECKSLGMKVWILDDKHFPSGYANGIFIEKYKELQPFGITERHVDIAGPVKDGSILASAWIVPEDELLAVLACRHVPNSDRYTEGVIDITAGLCGDFIYFELPEGLWRVVFLVKTRSGMTPQARIYSDKLEPKATRLYIEEVFESHYAHFKEDFGKTLLGFFSDEPCFHNDTIHGGYAKTGTPYTHFPWHERVAKGLKEIYGDEFYKELPGLWFDFEGDTSRDIRLNYMDIITRGFGECYSAPIAEWCSAHGVMYIGHIIEDNNIHAQTRMGPGHYFRAIGPMDMAGVDVVLHQIVPGLGECDSAGPVSYRHMNSNFFGYYLAKLASSLAHSDPKKKGRAMCEIFGAYGWAEGTKIMKYLTDHMLVRGINYFVPHAFSPKPDDPDCPPNFYDRGRNPQFEYFKLLMDYMNRCCHMLSGGEPDIKCALLYDAEAQWVGADYLPLEECAKVLYDGGIDYEILPVDSLQDGSGRYSLENISLVIVPWQGCGMPLTEERLEGCGIPFVYVVKGGAEGCLGQGAACACVTLDSLADYVDRLGLRDVFADREAPLLRHRHYMRAGAHIYMFVNEDINSPACLKVRLSSFSGGDYIQYDPLDNTALAKSADDFIPLSVAPYHSTMIIFGDVDASGIAEEEKTAIIAQKKIEGPFEISLKSAEQTDYSYYKTSEELFNMTGPKKRPHFSGRMRYTARFSIDDEGGYILDLGRVGETAELSVNGSPCKARVIPPYEFDISGLVRKGENTLCVTVSNTNVFSRRDGLSGYLLLEPSGLLGPVTIKKYVKVKE